MGKTQSIFDAIRDEDIASVRRLIRLGVDLNAKEDEVKGFTPLHEAVRWRSSEELFQLLLDAGAKIDARDEMGNTPLHQAATLHEKKEILSILVNNGADVNLKDSNGNSVLHHAIIGSCNFDGVEILINAGANVNSRNHDGATALHLAAKENKNLIAEYLISKCGADVNTKDKSDRTPLHWAARCNKDKSHLRLVKTLLKNCADPQALDEEDKMPINYFLRNDYHQQASVEIIELFVNHMGKFHNVKNKLEASKIKVVGDKDLDQTERKKYNEDEKFNYTSDAIQGEIKTEVAKSLSVLCEMYEKRWEVIEGRMKQLQEENDVLKNQIGNLAEIVNKFMQK